MNTHTDYKILKLVNGENIICIADEDKNFGGYEISFPLKIQTFPTMSRHGPVESCNLSRWVQPFTEEEYFHIKTENVILIADASPGIAAYYEHVIRQVNTWDNEDMGKLQDSIDKITESYDEPIDEEMLDPFDDMDNTIH